MTSNIFVFDNFTIIFFELALGLLLAVGFGLIARFFRQPLILAYVLTGILISLLGLARSGQEATLPLFANLGVAFLLFLVGIELRFSDLKTIGKSAVYIGLGQIIFTCLIGFVITRLLAFSVIESVYISIALTFSSTIIVVKLLSEKRDLNSLYGKIAIGFLLVQDFAAIIALILISGFDQITGAAPGIFELVILLVRGGLLFALAYFLNRLILPSLFRYTAQSNELLFITAISWCFIFASLAKVIGFTLEIGAFLAGLAIASSPFHLQISAKIRPLRDFFIVIFFILLGTNIVVAEIGQFVVPIIILSIFILIGNPLIVLIIMGLLGHKKRTSFQTAVTSAQISEFSLIVVAAGERVGHITSPVVALVAIIGVITITASSYMIIYSNYLYKKLSRFLELFEKRHLKEKRLSLSHFENQIILAGCEQMGRDILAFLINKPGVKENLIVVDFNPTVIQSLEADGYTAIFGDICDSEMLDELNLKKAKLIISTIPDFEDNQILIEFAKEAGFEGPMIVTSYWATDAIKLYEQGASYVVVPELVGGKHTVRILQDNWQNLPAIIKQKDQSFGELLQLAKVVS